MFLWLALSVNLKNPNLVYVLICLVIVFKWLLNSLAIIADSVVTLLFTWMELIVFKKIFVMFIISLISLISLTYFKWVKSVFLEIVTVMIKLSNSGWFK